MSILVVEDNLVSARLMDINLKKRGYEVVVANDGKDAQRILLKRSDINLIISDIMMPEMDGIELLEWIRAHNELRFLPVLMCTANKESEVVKKAAFLGCSGYITKPVDFQALIKKVQQIMSPEKTILLEKPKVMYKFALNVREYNELAKSFASSIASKITLVEHQIHEKKYQIAVETLMELKESSNLLGAERFKDLLVKIEHIEKNDEITERLLFQAIREMKALQDQLPGKPVENPNTLAAIRSAGPLSQDIDIRYEMPCDGVATLFIKDINNQIMIQLVNEKKLKGVYTVKWNYCNSEGVKLENGTYFIHLRAGSNVQMKEFVINR